MEGILSLYEALLRVDPDAEVTEAADWIWLAAILGGEAGQVSSHPEQESEGDRSAAPVPLRKARPETQISQPPQAAEKEPAPEPESVGEPISAERRAKLRNWAPGKSYGAEPGAIPFGTPGGRALPRSLDIARALRPLVRRVPATDLPPLLDEEGTIRRIVDSDNWIPASRCQTRPWLDLALIIDDSPSMRIWQRTSAELKELLGQLGAFRDIRVWRLRADRADGAPTLVPDAGLSARSHRELLSPARNRLILIVSSLAPRATA